MKEGGSIRILHRNIEKKVMYRLVALSIVSLFLIAALAVPITSGTTSASPFKISKAATSITMNVPDADPVVGSKVHADGVLKASKGISSARIYLKVTLPDSTVNYPSQGSSTRTGSGGSFGIDYTPTKVGTYKFTATYLGSLKYSSTSKTVTFDVKAVEVPSPISKSVSSITLSPSSSSIVIGSTMSASGMLSAGVGMTVGLAVTLPDGSTAYPTQGSQVVTGNDGAFEISYVPKTAGTYTFVAVFAGSDTFEASSASASFTATSPIPAPIPEPVQKKTSSMTMTLGSSSVVAGNTMHADVLLSSTSAIVGATVSLSVTLPSGSTVYPTQGSSATTDSSGGSRWTTCPQRSGPMSSWPRSR